MTQALDDKTILGDCLQTQKFLTSSYDMAIKECANDNLRRDFLTIYQEEQNNLKSVFDLMETKGLYLLQKADQQEITRVQQALQGQISSQMQATQAMAQQPRI